MKWQYVWQNKIDRNAVDNAELQETEMPDDWMKEVLIPVYKEGDKSSCHIYKGMTLLSHYCHKICERILRNEIKNWDCRMCEKQHVFTGQDQ